MSDFVEKLRDGNADWTVLRYRAADRIEKLEKLAFNTTGDVGCPACGREYGLRRRIEELEEVVEAANDYMWCIGDPPSHDMARAKLKQALAKLEES